MNFNKLKKWYDRGLQILDEEGSRSAYDYFEEGLDKGQDYHFLSHKGMGICHNEMNNYVLAIADFKGAIEIDSSDIEIWEELIHSYASIENYKEAEEACLNAIDLEKKKSQNWLNLGKLRIKLNNHDGAKEAIEKVLELEPGKLEALEKTVDLDLNSKKYKEAVLTCESLLNMDPKNYSLWNKLGVARFYLDDFLGAENAYRKADEFCPEDAAILYNIGESLWKQNKIDDALSYYERSIRQRPNSYDCWNDLAELYKIKNLNSESIYCTLWAKRIQNAKNPENPKASDPNDVHIPKIREIIPRVPRFIFDEKPYGWYSFIQDVSIVSMNQDPFNYELGDVVATMQEEGEKLQIFFDSDMILQEGLFKNKFNSNIWEQAVNTGDLRAIRTTFAKIKVQLLQTFMAPKKTLMIRSDPQLIEDLSQEMNEILIETARLNLPELVRFEANIPLEDWNILKKGEIARKYDAEKLKEISIKYADIYWDLDFHDTLLKLYHEFNEEL